MFWDLKIFTFLHSVSFNNSYFYSKFVVKSLRDLSEHATSTKPDDLRSASGELLLPIVLWLHMYTMAPAYLLPHHPQRINKMLKINICLLDQDSSLYQNPLSKIFDLHFFYLKHNVNQPSNVYFIYFFEYSDLLIYNSRYIFLPKMTPMNSYLLYYRGFSNPTFHYQVLKMSMYLKDSSYHEQDKLLYHRVESLPQVLIC